MAGAEVASTAFWAEGLEDAERARRLVVSQRMIAALPLEARRKERDLFNVRLYENNPSAGLYGLGDDSYNATGEVPLPPPERSGNNKAKAAIDTLASQVASTEQRARFKTVDGNGRQRRRARELQNFADGLAYELKLHRLRQRAFFDAAILESGKGFVQFYKGPNNRCAAQRVLATEITIAPRDGLVNGQWRTIYRKRPMARDGVMADFGNTKARREAVANVKSVSAAGGPEDDIDVFEAWTLPTSEEAKDGWHVIGLDIGEGDLLVEPYVKDHHEIVGFSLEDRFMTGWGLSLMTQVAPLQININANRYRIEKSQAKFHAQHLYVTRSSQVKKSSLTNEIGSVWEGNDPNPPQQITFQAASPELYQQVITDGELIFANLGISVSAAVAETQSGLDESGAAKREEVKKSDQRNSVRQQRWEQFHIDCMRAALGVVREIVGAENEVKKGNKKAAKSSYVVGLPNKRGLTKVDWADVATDEKDYVLEVMPASPVPTDPAGLVAYGERMIELQVWKPDELGGYMQDLDADGRTNSKMAQRRVLEKTFESLLYDKASAAQPDEFTPFALAMEIGLDYLAQGADDGVPPKHLERVRRYLRQVKTMQAKVIAATAPPAAPAAAGAPPAPAAAPVAA